MKQAIRLSDAAADELVLTVDACGLRCVTQQLFASQNTAIREYLGQAASYAVVEE